MSRLLSQLFRTGELEALSDERYERLRLQAEARRGDAAWVIPFGVGAVALMAWMCLGFGLAFGVSALSGAGAGSSGPLGPTIDLTRVGWVNLVVGSAIGGIAGGFAREWMLAKSILGLLNRGACPYCEFSLKGLHVDLGAVRCPECGRVVVLHEHGIRVEDIMTDGPRIAAPEAGALGAYEGRVPVGSKRRIRRAAGGIPTRAEAPPKRDEGLSGEVL